MSANPDHPNFAVINRFFDAYGRRDQAALDQALTEDVTWTFPGRNPFSGVKRGRAEVVGLFDALGRVMGQSGVQAETLIRSASDDYVLEAQHVWTNRPGGPNLDHHWCVLWTFRDGQIAAGRHFAADQYAADAFFNQFV